MPSQLLAQGQGPAIAADGLRDQQRRLLEPRPLDGLAPGTQRDIDLMDAHRGAPAAIAHGRTQRHADEADGRGTEVSAAHVQDLDGGRVGTGVGVDQRGAEPRRRCSVKTYSVRIADEYKLPETDPEPLQQRQ